MKSLYNIYGRAFRNDLPASLMLALVAVPICLGTAFASNAPILSGLIAAIVGAIAVGAISRSSFSVSGPSFSLVAITAAAIITLPSFQAFLVSVVIAGVLQLVLGYLRIGNAIKYVPKSVTKGIIAATGLLLIVSQLPQLLGYASIEPLKETGFETGNLFINLLHALSNIDTATAIIGAICLLSCIFLDRMFSNTNRIFSFAIAALIAICIGTIVTAVYANLNTSTSLSIDSIMLPVASSFNSFQSYFSTPDFNELLNARVIVTGLIIGLVASIESLLTLEATNSLDPNQSTSSANRELKAQGVGNIISGLLGGLPISAGIVRTSANYYAGAKTKMAGIYQGILIIILVAFVPSIVNLIPKAAVSAVLIFLGYKIINPAIFKSIYKKGNEQFVPFIATIVAVVATDLFNGVLIGLAFGLFYMTRTKIATSLFVVNDGNKYLFRVRNDVSFLNKPLIKAGLENIPANSSVLIDVSRTDFIDNNVVETIEDFLLLAPLKNINVSIKGNLHTPGTRSKAVETKPKSFQFSEKEEEMTMSEKI